MSLLSHDSYLFVVAHQDDESLYFGGLLLYLKKMGAKLTVLCITQPKEGRPDTNTRQASFEKACALVGAECFTVGLVDYGPDGINSFIKNQDWIGFAESAIHVMLERSNATIIITHNFAGEGVATSTYKNGHAVHKAVAKAASIFNVETYCDCVGLTNWEYDFDINVEEKKKMLDCYLPYWKPDAYPFWKEKEKYKKLPKANWNNLKTISYYYPSQPGDFKFWEFGIGQDLPKALNPNCEFMQNKSDKFGTFYDPKEGEYDAAYIQLFTIPNKRPAKFLYTYISDYYPQWLIPWAEKVKPNLICFLQEIPAEFKQRADTLGIKCVLSPWFITERKPYIEDKKNHGFCAGWIGPNYPKRRAIYEELRKNYPGVLLSCSDQYQKYPLMGKDYENALITSKYFFSGGIFDRLVPPKYYEACGAGTCLVCHKMPIMEELGFKNGYTYIELHDYKDIGVMLGNDDWKSISKNGHAMVNAQHHVSNRAKQIAWEYNEWSAK